MSWAGPYQFSIGKGSSASESQAVVHDPSRPTLVCLSHLRWGFVYQRPQHLIARFAREWNVIYVEEPLVSDAPAPWLETRIEEGVTVVVPRHPAHCSGDALITLQRGLLDALLATRPGSQRVLWYYTPMALPFSDHLRADLVVYDCMDELSAFRGAPPDLLAFERSLLQRADLVFTGGYSLYEAKRDRHPSVHPFPSSVDVEHFGRARLPQQDPVDQLAIPRPRLGFYGVIDERFDIDLLARVARERPEWHFVMVGPVVKIDPAELPQAANIHWLGPKTYDELPHYLSGWQVALMPFALNESTRFISPTKTPEYLAGGCPVVSTPITDVVRTYGDTGVVRIAGTPDEFIVACARALDDSADPGALLATADAVLQEMSWDQTWLLMKEKMQCAMADWKSDKQNWPRPVAAVPSFGQRRPHASPLENGASTTSSSEQGLPAV